MITFCRNIYSHFNINKHTLLLHYNFTTRSIRQQHKQSLIYHRQPTRLINSPINLKYLVPSNIFQQQVTIQQYQKQIISNKSINYFQNSYVSINLNIAENSSLRNRLIRFDNKAVRIGRLLEIMDMIGGLVSYRHCFGSFKKHNSFTLVTGSVQSLQFFQQFNTEQDILVEGFVNNTGRTSMQIEVNITQGEKLKANSYFTMVSRSSKDLSVGVVVPQLDVSRLQQKEIIKAQKRRQLALQHIQRRKKQITQSFDVRPPNAQQIKQIHQIFLLRKKKLLHVQQKSHSKQQSSHPKQQSPSLLLKQQQNHKNEIKISQTYTQTNGIMHLQDRNINGKIFGGYLMRQMLEIGWVAGMKFLNGQLFQVDAITDMYFLSAVGVGDGLTISAAVTYTQGSTVIISVQASTMNFLSNTKRLCCSCQLILQTSSQVKRVYPCSYEEAIGYLSSRRVYGKLVGGKVENKGLLM